MGLNVERLSPIVFFLAMVGLSWVQNNLGQLFYIALNGYKRHTATGAAMWG